MMITLSYYVYSSLVSSKRIIIMLLIPNLVILVYLIIPVGVVFHLLSPCLGLPTCNSVCEWSTRVKIYDTKERASSNSAKGEHQCNDVSNDIYVCKPYVWSNHINVWCCTCSFFIQPLVPNNQGVCTITINTCWIPSVEDTIVIVSSLVCPAGIH